MGWLWFLQGDFKWFFGTAVLALVVPLQAWCVYADVAGLNTDEVYMGGLAGAIHTLRQTASKKVGLEKQDKELKRINVTFAAKIKKENEVLAEEKMKEEVLQAEVDSLKAQKTDSIKELQEHHLSQQNLLKEIAVTLFLLLFPLASEKPGLSS